MKALVTGAAGFIGSHLVNRLVKTGYSVRALVREGTDCSKIHSPKVEIIRGDIQNYTDIKHAMDGCDLVFHLAVSRGNRDIILAGASNIAQAAADSGVKRLVFSSSAGVYRKTKDTIVNEDTPIKPDPGYHEYQAEAETILLDSWKDGGIPIVIARITSLGPCDPRWRGVFQTIASGTFRMVGPGNNHYQPVDVTDVAEGLFLCGTVPNIEGQTYILAGSKPYSLHNIIRAIDYELGVTSAKSSIPIFAFRAYRALNNVILACGGKNLPRVDRASFFLYNRKFDLTRARTELGYSPKISLEETIRKTAELYRKEGAIPLQNRSVSSN